MKKAKFVLLAIALLGVLGSTLAFKTAKRFAVGNLLYVTTKANSPACLTLANGITTPINQPGAYRWYTSRKCDNGVLYSKLTINL